MKVEYSIRTKRSIFAGLIHAITLSLTMRLDNYILSGVLFSCALSIEMYMFGGSMYSTAITTKEDNIKFTQRLKLSLIYLVSLISVSVINRFTFRNTLTMSIEDYSLFSTFCSSIMCGLLLGVIIIFAETYNRQMRIMIVIPLLFSMYVTDLQFATTNIVNYITYDYTCNVPDVIIRIAVVLAGNILSLKFISFILRPAKRNYHTAW